MQNVSVNMNDIKVLVTVPKSKKYQVINVASDLSNREIASSLYFKGYCPILNLNNRITHRRLDLLNGNNSVFFYVVDLADGYVYSYYFTNFKNNYDILKNLSEDFSSGFIMFEDKELTIEKRVIL